MVEGRDEANAEPRCVFHRVSESRWNDVGADGERERTAYWAELAQPGLMEPNVNDGETSWRRRSSLGREGLLDFGSNAETQLATA